MPRADRFATSLTAVLMALIFATSATGQDTKKSQVSQATSTAAPKNKPEPIVLTQYAPDDAIDLVNDLVKKKTSFMMVFYDPSPSTPNIAQRRQDRLEAIGNSKMVKNKVMPVILISLSTEEAFQKVLVPLMEGGEAEEVRLIAKNGGATLLTWTPATKWWYPHSVTQCTWAPNQVDLYIDSATKNKNGGLPVKTTQQPAPAAATRAEESSNNTLAKAPQPAPAPTSNK